MVRINVFLALLFAIISTPGCHALNHQHDPSHEKRHELTEVDVLFEGTVQELKIVDDDMHPYLVIIRVDKVIEGDFKEKTFSFKIHSPTRSQIKLNQKYKVELKKTMFGYKVNLYGWKRYEIQ